MDYFPTQADVHTNPSMRITTIIAPFALMLFGSQAAAATFHYEASFAGIPVGMASVVVERSVHEYRIEGNAAVRGVAAVFSDWQSEFHAVGVFIAAKPKLASYGFHEKERNKTRVLTLSNGVVAITRNGTERPARPVPDGLDVLTAFFVAPQCWPRKLLHTGRYNYRIDGNRSAERNRCTFRVEDDDGDISRVHMEFEEHLGMTIPTRMTTGGFPRGRIVLKQADDTKTD
jgi:hypothetical protein